MSSRKTLRLAALVAAGCVAGGLAIGHAFAASGPSVEVVGQPATYSDAVGNLPAAASLDAGIATAQKNMASTAIDSAKLIARPSEIGPRPGLGVDSVPWLEINLHAPNDYLDGNGIPIAWQAALFQGAVAELSRGNAKALNDVIGGTEIHVTLADGSTVPVDYVGSGAVAPGQVFGDPNRTDDTIAESVRQTLVTFGLTPTQVQVLRPLGPAVSITATLPSDAQIKWSIDQLRAALLGSPLAYEGINIEIDDATSGKALIRSASAYRSGDDFLWFAPGQDERFQVNHGHMPIQPPN